MIVYISLDGRWKEMAALCASPRCPEWAADVVPKLSTEFRRKNVLSWFASQKNLNVTLLLGKYIMKEAIRRWLKKAREDLDDAKFSISGSRYNLGGFMLQQALEKALKALHLEKYGKFEYTYNLVMLSADFDIPEKYQRICEIPIPLYTGFRYPDVAEGDVENIDEILGIAEEMIQWIEKRFNV